MAESKILLAIIIAFSLLIFIISPSTVQAADTTPPIISNVHTLQLENNRVLVAWDTDEPSNSVVIYGRTPSSIDLNSHDDAMVTSHSVVLPYISEETLQPGITYYYEVQSFDSSSNRARDTNNGNYYSFTVTGQGTPVMNTIGAKKYQSTSVTQGGRGNMFQVTDSSLALREVKTYLNLVAPQTLYFAIYKSTSPTGIFYREPYEPILTNQGPGEGWYSSGTISWPLQQGYYYMIVTWWDGTAQYWADDFTQITYPSLGIVRTGIWGNPPASLPPETWNLDYTQKQLTYQQITTQTDTTACTDECFPEDYQYCSSSAQYRVCGRSFDADPCLENSQPQTCGTYCDYITNHCAVSPICIDADHDSYGQSCAAGPDCNDANPNIHPGAAEICNAYDDNCNGQTDEGCNVSQMPYVEVSVHDSCAHFYASFFGTPYSGVSVSGSGSGIEWNGVTNAQGIFEKCELMSGYYDWKASYQQAQIQDGTLYVNPAGAYLVRGYVRDSNNNPVSGASMQLRSQCGSLGDNIFFYPASTDTNGYFTASIPNNNKILQQVVAAKIGFQNRLTECGDAPKSDGNVYSMALLPTAIEICSDGVDNDMNGKIDCSDMACQMASTCTRPVPLDFLFLGHDGKPKFPLYTFSQVSLSDSILKPGYSELMPWVPSDFAVRFLARLKNIPAGASATIMLYNPKGDFEGSQTRPIHAESEGAEPYFWVRNDNLLPLDGRSFSFADLQKFSGKWTVEMYIDSKLVAKEYFLIEMWGSDAVDAFRHDVSIKGGNEVCLQQLILPMIAGGVPNNYEKKMRLTPGSHVNIHEQYIGYYNPLNLVSLEPSLAPVESFVYVWIFNATGEGDAVIKPFYYPAEVISVHPIIIESTDLESGSVMRTAFYKLPVPAQSPAAPAFIYAADISIPFTVPPAGSKGLVFSLASTSDISVDSIFSEKIRSTSLDYLRNKKINPAGLILDLTSRGITNAVKSRKIFFVSKPPEEEVVCNPLGSPADLHLYDSLGNHVGVNATGGLESKVPDAFYSYSETGPESILLVNPVDSYSLKTVPAGNGAGGIIHIGVERSSNGKAVSNVFELASKETTNTALQIITGKTMLVDIDGDGIFEQILSPKKEETIETACFDGSDNDGNNFTDCQDSACAIQCNAPPISVIQGPRKVLQNQPDAFDASASIDFDGNISGFEWQLDSIPSSSAKVFSPFLTPGQHFILLKTTDNNGAADSEQIDVKALPAFIAPASGLARLNPLFNPFAPITKGLITVTGETLYLAANVTRGNDGQQYSMNVKILDSQGNVMLSDTQGTWSSGPSFLNNGTPFQASWVFSASKNSDEYKTDASTLVLLHLNEAVGNVAVDVSGNEFNGTISGTTVCAGKYLNCRAFHGASTDFISIPASLELNSNDATFEAWVKPYVLKQALIINKYGDDSIRGRQLSISSDGRAVVSAVLPNSKGGKAFNIQSANPLPLNIWSHIAGVFDETNGKLRLYVNGKLEQETALDSGTENGYGITIGKYDPANDALFNGEVDEVRISKKARLVSELQSNKNNFTSIEVNKSYYMQLQIINSTGAIIDTENYVLKTNSDADGDEMADDWEQAAGLDLVANDANADKDNDRLTNYNEYKIFTNPLNADSDSGGMFDGDEVMHGQNPLDASDDVKPDTTTPNISIAQPITRNYSSEETIILQFTATDENLAKVSATLDGIPVSNNQTIQLSSLTLGLHTFIVSANDTAGNAANQYVQFIVIDITLPLIAVNSPAAKNYSYTTVLLLNFNATDNRGIASLATKLDGTTVFNGQTINLSGFVLGSHDFIVMATDMAGNNASKTVIFEVIDDISPVSKATPNGMLAPDGWYTSNVTVTLTAVDEKSAVNFIEYSLDNASFVRYTNPLAITSDGSHTLIFRAVDAVGNVEITKTIQIKIRRVSAGTVGLWHLDEASGSIVLDYSGYKNDGTAAGTIISTACILGKCRSFSGKDYITISNNSLLNSKDATYEAWVYPTQFGSAMIVINKYGTDAQRGRQLGITSQGKPYALASTKSRGTKYSATSLDALPLNKWSRLSAVFDETKGKIRIYVNGVLKSEKALAAGTDKALPVTFGRYPAANNAYFKGNIDEVQIFNTAKNIV